MKYETKKQKQQGQLQSILDPQRKLALASYKLAYIIGKTRSLSLIVSIMLSVQKQRILILLFSNRCRINK